MILKEKTLSAVLEMLDKEGMKALVHETGIEIDFLWETEHFATFVPYKYDVTVNEDGYPEVTAAGVATDNGWF